MKEKELPEGWMRITQVRDPLTGTWKHYATIQNDAEYTLAKILRNAYPGIYRIIRVRVEKIKLKTRGENNDRENT